MLRPAEGGGEKSSGKKESGLTRQKSSRGGTSDMLRVFIRKRREPKGARGGMRKRTINNVGRVLFGQEEIEVHQKKKRVIFEKR